MKSFSAILLLAMLAAGFLWERSASDKLRAENEALLVAKQEAEQLAAENRELPGLRAAAAAVERSDHTELLRLRNQIRQLRAQQQEADKLRAANQRLAEDNKSGKFAQRGAADTDGVVLREKWAFAGFDTPEASVQTYFAAIVSGDPEQIIRCASPAAAELMRNVLANDPEKVRRAFQQGSARVSASTGYRIKRNRKLADDYIEIEVEPPIFSKSDLRLKRFGSEWKVSD